MVRQIGGRIPLDTGRRIHIQVGYCRSHKGLLYLLTTEYLLLPLLHVYVWTYFCHLSVRFRGILRVLNQNTDMTLQAWLLPVTSRYDMYFYTYIRVLLHLHVCSMTSYLRSSVGGSWTWVHCLDCEYRGIGFESHESTNNILLLCLSVVMQRRLKHLSVLLVMYTVYISTAFVGFCCNTLCTVHTYLLYTHVHDRTCCPSSTLTIE